MRRKIDPGLQGSPQYVWSQQIEEGSSFFFAVRFCFWFCLPRNKILGARCDFFLGGVKGWMWMMFMTWKWWGFKMSVEQFGVFGFPKPNLGWGIPWCKLTMNEGICFANWKKYHDENTLIWVGNTVTMGVFNWNKNEGICQQETHQKIRAFGCDSAAWDTPWLWMVLLWVKNLRISWRFLCCTPPKPKRPCPIVVGRVLPLSNGTSLGDMLPMAASFHQRKRIKTHGWVLGNQRGEHDLLSLFRPVQGRRKVGRSAWWCHHTSCEKSG